jgi:hypothetical protein
MTRAAGGPDPVTAGRSSLLPFLVIGSTLVGVIVAIGTWEIGGVVLFIAFGGVGAFLATRRPGNSIGWLLLLTAWGLSLGSVRVAIPVPEVLAGGLEPEDAAAVVASGWGWSLAFVGLLALALVFPTGRLPGGRAALPSRVLFAAAILISAIMAVAPMTILAPAGSSLQIEVPNPLALAPGAAIWAIVPSLYALYPTLFVLVILGVLGLIMRWRRSSGLERQQYRWLAAAVALATIATALWALFSVATEQDPLGLTWIAVVVTYSSVPLAIGFAVMRYRLYDIDRIVSRTVSWAVVTGLLVAVFVSGVLAMQAVLAGVTQDETQGETLAVAVSTLVAFALFQPVRRRVQRVVDRRFDRARYDGARIADAFAERLRDEVDLPTVAADLDTTVRTSLAPAHVAFWLRRTDP